MSSFLAPPWAGSMLTRVLLVLLGKFYYELSCWSSGHATLFHGVPYLVVQDCCLTPYLLPLPLVPSLPSWEHRHNGRRSTAANKYAAGTFVKNISIIVTYKTENIINPFYEKKSNEREYWMY